MVQTSCVLVPGESRPVPNPLRRYPSGSRPRVPEALLHADSFEDLPGKWQAAILRQKGTARSCGLVTGDR
jgi:hypothetical protein